MKYLRAKILNCISLLQFVKYRSGVDGYDEDIIGMRPNLIVASLLPPNPDIKIRTSWINNHCPQDM